MFPDLSCSLSKSACYLMKTVKGIYDTMPNLDLSIYFISVFLSFLTF